LPYDLIIIGADYVVRRRRYRDDFVMVCVWGDVFGTVFGCVGVWVCTILAR